MSASVSFLLLEVSLSFGPAPAQNLQQILHPEDLAGRWEAPDGHGAEVGLNIEVTTSVPYAANRRVDGQQRLEDLTVATYRRSGAEVAPLDLSWFDTSPKGGAKWDGRRLWTVLDPGKGHPQTQFDLVWDEKARNWTGTYQRDDFRNRAITLRRPRAVVQSAFVGTWMDDRGPMNNCLHIAQAGDGSLTGWSESINIPRLVTYGSGIRPPERVSEHYGEIAKVTVGSEHEIEVTLAAYTALCCSPQFSATLSRDQRHLVVFWPEGATRGGRQGQWTRVHGEARAPAARPLPCSPTCQNRGLR